MSVKEVKDLAKYTISSFFNDQSSEEIMSNLIKDLNISDEKQEPTSNETVECSRHSLFRELQKLKIPNRKKGKWFTYNYWEDLKRLLSKYPNEHHTIMKALRISRSSYYRLIKEFKTEHHGGCKANRELRNNLKLTKQEKVYVHLLVNPPTIPLTINGI